MQTQRFETQEEWLEARKGRITGTGLGKVVSKRETEKKKAGVYELIAQHLALPAEKENPLERGHRLEPEAIELYKKQLGKEIETELIILSRDDNKKICFSPDGIVKDEPIAIEVKCLNSGSHIEALITQEVPDEYDFQTLQPFIVWPELKELHVVFYDPRLAVHQLHVIVVRRDVNQARIDKYLDEERKVLEYVEQWVEKLSF